MDLHNEDQEKRLENKNLLVRSAGCANVQAYDMAILDMDGCIPTSIDDYPPNPVYAVAKKLEAQFYGIPEDTPDATIMNWIIEQKVPSHIQRQYEALQKARGQRRGARRQMLELPQQANVDSMEIEEEESLKAAVQVVCGSLMGTLRLWGDDKGSIDIIMETANVVTMAEFARLAGTAAAKSPMRSIFVINNKGVPMKTVAKWYYEDVQQPTHRPTRHRAM